MKKKTATTKKARTTRAKKVTRQPRPSSAPTARADPFLFSEGTLLILSVDQDQQFHMPARSRKVAERAASAVGEMLRQGYAILLANRDDIHVRVREFDPRKRSYIVPGPEGTDIRIPISRSRAIAVPRQAGG